MKYTHGTVTKFIQSADGKGRVDIVARDDGLFEFRAYQLTETDPPGDTYWLPTHNSGLYDLAEEAEREAREIVPLVE